MKLRLFCRCGAAWWIVAEGDHALELVADWEREHGPAAGPGHAPCSDAEAEQARWRQSPAAALAGSGRLLAAERSDR